MFLRPGESPSHQEKVSSYLCKEAHGSGTKLRIYQLINKTPRLWGIFIKSGYIYVPIKESAEKKVWIKTTFAS